MGLKITGLDKCVKRFEDLDAKLQKGVIIEELLEAMQPMADAVRSHAPVGATGKMKASIKLKKGRTRGDVVSALVQLSAKDFAKFYGSFVEYLGDDPSEFFEKGWNQASEMVRADAMERILKAIDDIVDRG